LVWLFESLAGFIIFMQKKSMNHHVKGRIAAFLAGLSALLTLYASLRGIMNQKLYTDVAEAGTISSFLVTGSLAQDIILLPTTLLLLVLTIRFLGKPSLKILIMNLGLISFIFYGYGLYVIQDQYTDLYVMYLAIFGLSLYTMIYGLLAVRWDEASSTSLPKPLRASLAAFLLLIPLVLIPVWLTLIFPDILAHTPSDTYAVFILDLCIVFPALVIIAWLLFANRPAGNILGGVAIIKAFTICLSVAFGEWFQGFTGNLPLNTGMLAIFLPLTLVSLALVIWYFSQLKITP